MINNYLKENIFDYHLNHIDINLIILNLDNIDTKMKQNDQNIIHYQI